MSRRWYCDVHRAWVTTDCPWCDDEQIAGLDEVCS